MIDLEESTLTLKAYDEVVKLNMLKSMQHNKEDNENGYWVDMLESIFGDTFQYHIW